MAGPPFRTVTILSTEKDDDWCKYLVGKFKTDKLHLNIVTLNVSYLDYENPPEIKTAVAESYVVMLLTTCYFLEYMEKEHHWFAQVLEDRDKSITTVVASTLCVGLEELQGVIDKYNYNSDKTWKINEINADCSNIKECISDILGMTDKNAAVRSKRLPARTFSDPLKSKPSEPRESFEIIPDRMHKAGEKVAVLFSKEKAKGSVTVHSGGINIQVETVNPYCITFKAPEITGTKISLHVDVNKIKLGKFTLHYSQPPSFTSLELLCQSFGVTEKEELDDKLAEKFASSMCADNRAMAILSDVIYDTSTVTGKHDSLYPTLLHWAAANGLREFCCVLLSAPGANQACTILNQDDDDVSDLAEKNGYEDLADYIIEFTETKEIAEACDYYVQYCSAPLDTTQFAYVDMSTPGIIPRSPAAPPISPRSTSQAKPSTLPPQSSPTDAKKLAARDFLAVNIIPQLAMGAIGSRSQAELIEIQEEVKKGNFSIREAEMLFNSWKARYETGNAVSFKERQQSLQAMREEYRKTMDLLKAAKCKKKEKRNKNKQPPMTIESISEPIRVRIKFDTMFSCPEPGRGDSIASYDSGRYSNLSQNSTSSEEVEFDDETRLLRNSRSKSEKSTGRLTDFRQSNRDLYLKLMNDTQDVPESSPPPLPPRLNQPHTAGEKRPPPPVPTKSPQVPAKPPPLTSKKPPLKFNKQ